MIDGGTIGGDTTAYGIGIDEDIDRDMDQIQNREDTAEDYEDQKQNILDMLEKQGPDTGRVEVRSFNDEPVQDQSQMEHHDVFSITSIIDPFKLAQQYRQKPSLPNTLVLNSLRERKMTAPANASHIRDKSTFATTSRPPSLIDPLTQTHIGKTKNIRAGLSPLHLMDKLTKSRQGQFMRTTNLSAMRKVLHKKPEKKNVNFKTLRTKKESLYEMPKMAHGTRRVIISRGGTGANRTRGQAYFE